jgi:hypothetical protein
MATEAARLEDKELTGRKKKNRLDSHRPSHGRTLKLLGALYATQRADDIMRTGNFADDATQESLIAA